MVDVKKELASNQTVLLLMPSVEYNDVAVEVMKKIGKGNVCYVTLNKTYAGLRETFKKKKVDIDNVIFIDAISKSLKKAPDQGEQVYYVSNPGALTELSLTISKFLRHDFDYLVFDSLTNLLIYQKKAPCAKFISGLINKIKSGKTKAVFYALDIKEQGELIEQAGGFVDKVVNTSGKKVKSDRGRPSDSPGEVSRKKKA